MRRLSLFLILLLVFAPTAAQGEEIVNWLTYETIDEYCVQYVYDADTHETARLVDGCGMGWSLDGQYFIYFRVVGGELRMFRLDVVNNAHHLIFEMEAEHLIGFDTFISNSQLLLALTNNSPESCQWYALDIISSELQQIANITQFNACDGRPEPSPAGQWLIFPSTDYRQDIIYILNLEDYAIQQVRNVYEAVWSPNGERIAFRRRDLSIELSGIFLMDADGKNPIQLTSGDNDYSPVWSPDSQQIAYMSCLDAVPAILLIDTQSQAIQILKELTLACSEDALWLDSVVDNVVIYATRFSTRITHHGVDLTTGNDVIVSQSRIYGLSPNNCYEAFMRDTRFASDLSLYVRRTNNAEEFVEITNAEPRIGSVSWRPQPNAEKEC